VPKVKEAGASDEVLRQITNDNPRRFLAFVPKVKRKVRRGTLAVLSLSACFNQI
jgi:hypothetical protein